MDLFFWQRTLNRSSSVDPQQKMHTLLDYEKNG